MEYRFAGETVWKKVAATCVFDRVLPTVQITSFVGGMLKGTVTDNYLDYWEIAMKEKNEPESAYRQLARGTQKVQDGLIKSISLDERQFTAGVTYDFRLTACDKAKNSNFAELSYTVKPGDADTTNYLEIENKTGNALQKVTWYIDDYKVAESKLHSENGEVLDFYKIKNIYNNQKQHEIIAQFTDVDGNITYSVFQGKSAVYEEIVSTAAFHRFSPRRLQTGMSM